MLVGLLSTSFVTPARAQPVALVVELTEYALSPDRLEVVLGEEVRIRLINNGTVGHNFILQDYANYDPVIAPGRSANVSFIADRVGTYSMSCGIPGHRALGMEGTFVIARAPPTPLSVPILEVGAVLVAAGVAATAVVVLLRSRRDLET
jgi:uncharacterized cupredoxin-like copper-binding protein